VDIIGSMVVSVEWYFLYKPTGDVVADPGHWNVCRTMHTTRIMSLHTTLQNWNIWKPQISADGQKVY